MGFTLPNPTVPTNSQTLDATPLLANLVAIAQAIASFDGSQIQAGSIVAAAMNANINPNTLLSETTFPFVASGLVWSADSAGASLNGSMTAGVLYINGIRITIGAITAHAFTASKDTYVDIDVNGNVTYSEVTNNAASPSLAANSVRIAIVVTGASIAATASINQGQEDRILPIASSIAYSVTDSLGNLICNRSPKNKLIGYRQILTTFNAGTNALTDVTGLSVPFIAVANRKIKATTKGNIFTSGTIRRADIVLRESSTQLSEGSQYPPAASNPVDVSTEYLATVSAGLHTYKTSIQCASGANVSLEAGGTQAVFIKVELE